MWDLTRYALNFFQTYLPFWEMSQQDALTANPADYCLAKPGEVYAIYLPGGSTTRLNLQKQTRAYSVQWYNPRTGGELQNGNINSVKGGGQVEIGTPPTDKAKDWIALIRKKRQIRNQPRIYHRQR